MCFGFRSRPLGGKATRCSASRMGDRFRWLRLFASFFWKCWLHSAKACQPGQYHPANACEHNSYGHSQPWLIWRKFGNILVFSSLIRPPFLFSIPKSSSTVLAPLSRASAKWFGVNVQGSPFMSTELPKWSVEYWLKSFVSVAKCWTCSVAG